MSSKRLRCLLRSGEWGPARGKGIRSRVKSCGVVLCGARLSSRLSSLEFLLVLLFDFSRDLYRHPRGGFL